MEVHNPISALIAETSSVNLNGIEIEYDGFWSSSLTDSTSKGKPDIEAVDISSRLKSIDDILRDYDAAYTQTKNKGRAYIQVKDKYSGNTNQTEEGKKGILD